MSTHELEARITFTLTDDANVEDWRVHQYILEELVAYVKTLQESHIVGDPQVRRVVPSSKNKSED